jgi:hypothetical protein
MRGGCSSRRSQTALRDKNTVCASSVLRAKIHTLSFEVQAAAAGGRMEVCGRAWGKEKF